MMVVKAAVQSANDVCKKRCRPDSSSQASKPVKDIASKGPTSDEERTCLERDGPNVMPDTSTHPLRTALAELYMAGVF